MARSKSATDTPTRAPSDLGTDDLSTDTGGMSRPTRAPEERVDVTTAGMGEHWPVLQPPGTAGATTSLAVTSGVTGTWTSGVRCDATWSINQTRNAFFHVAGGGWKKIFNGSDGAFMALCTLAAQAKQTGHQMAIREEADGMVHEIYLW